MTAAAEIISFGYLYGEPPQAHITIDVRHHFRDPLVDPALRHLTALDPEVMQAVVMTPGAGDLVTAIADMVDAFHAGPSAGPVTVAIGCAGGRHRSAAIAIRVARLLELDGTAAAVTHRDIAKPVAERRPS